jgi:phosphate transport system protein
MLQADLVLAEQVISDHETVSAMSACAEEKAFVLLARQAPVAGDLRAIVSWVQSVADVTSKTTRSMICAGICSPS